jgi:pimeloyl-ACP methyl ester carboxylesterase
MPFAPISNGSTTQFYYEDTGGSGPPIVFSHGFLMDSTMFAPQVALLQANYRCITWDQRGHGQTAGDRLSPFDFYDSANDLSALLDFLVINSAILVGMSQGGFLTLRCALTNPTAAVALILIDTEAGVMLQPQINGDDQLLGAWCQGGLTPTLGGLIAAQILGPGPSDPIWPGTQAWIDKWTNVQLVNLIASFNALTTRDDISLVMPAIKAPALVIHGTDDQSIPIAQGQALAAGLANASFAPIQGAGHCSCLTFPDPVNAQIAAFLATLNLLPPPPVPAEEARAPAMA